MNDAWTDRLSDLLDGNLSEEDAHEARRHVAECRACADTLRDLERVRDWARGFSAPGDDDGWPELGARIERARSGSSVRAVFPTAPVRYAAAAVLVLAATYAWLRGGGPGDDVAPGAVVEAAADTGPDSPGLGLAATSDAPPTELAAEVAALERLLSERRSGLPAETVAVLEESLSAIDAALSRVRTQLDADPANDLLRELERRAAGHKARVLRLALLDPSA